MSEFKNRLSRMGQTWSSGKQGPPGVPAGVYNMQMQKCCLKESANGAMMIEREHLILDGQHEGEVVRDYMNLETAYGPRFATQFIEKMGYESPDNPEDLEELVAAIANDAPTYQAKVKVSGDFRNVDIIRLTEKPATSIPASTVKKPQPPPPPVKQNSTKPEPLPVKKVEPTPPPASTTFEVGADVTFSDGETTFEGKVQEDKGESVVVETDAGDLYEVETSKVSLADVEVVQEATEEAPEGEDSSDLIAFCQAHDIEVTEDESRDSCIEKINKFEYKKSELTPEELTLLEGIEASFEVEEKPKAKPAPKPAPKVTAKPSPTKTTPPAKKKK